MSERVLTPQQVFDIAVGGLLAQGKHSLAYRSWDNEGMTVVAGVTPAYRGSDGCKCPVGHVIDDEFYSPKIEGLCLPFFHATNWVEDEWWRNGGKRSSTPLALLARALFFSGVRADSVPVLEGLQQIHDSQDEAEYWPRDFERVCLTHRLDPRILAPYLEECG